MRMHLDEYHVPFLRFSKYNLFLPAFLDSCTNHAYMVAIAIRVSSTVSFPCDVLCTLYDCYAYHLSSYIKSCNLVTSGVSVTLYDGALHALCCYECDVLTLIR
jgi:hypothetical protein